MVHAETEVANEPNSIDRFNSDDIEHKGQVGSEPLTVIPEGQRRDP